MNINVKTSRRGFMKSVAAGALVVAVPLPTPGIAETSGPRNTLGHFIAIQQDGKIDLTVPTFEIGQGAHTSLAMIIADELGASWEDVSVHAPQLNAAMNTPGWEQQIVAGSFSVRLWYTPLRQAAAQAREMMIAAAAEEWAVPKNEILVADSTVSHDSSGNSSKFAELVDKASQLTPPEEPTLRTEHTLIGRSIPRVDLPGKIDGSARFGIDIRVPDMVYAAIRHAPTFGAGVSAIDRTPLEDMRGIVDVVELPSAVMVVADAFWRAKKGVDALDITFAASEFDGISTADIIAAQNANLDREDGGVAIDEGDAPAAIAKSKVFDERSVTTADYTVPFLYHAPMEPMTCTAHVEGDRCTVWAPTQDITTATNTAAKAAGIPPENVEVHAIYAGGGFGRKYENDFVDQAVRASLAVKRPVQLIWSREEDVQHDFYRPSVSARMTGSVEPDGSVSAFSMRLSGQSVIEHSFGIAVLDGFDPVTTLGISSETGSSPGKIQQYDIPNAKVDYIHQPTHVPVGYWRAVGASHNGFFLESFVDEMAHENEMDPYEFRRGMLKDSPRGLAVLDRAAEESGWETPPTDGRFRGIAFSEAVGSIVAFVVELSMQDGEPTVHRVTVAIDCGIAVNPDSVDAQMVGGTIMGVGSALYEEVVIENGRAAHENFFDYRVIGLAETPQIDVHIIESTEPPGGVGEAAIPGVAPAITNAIFAATGKRIRSLPVMSNI